MIHFECDYVCGCHPDLMQALVRSNDVQAPGYGFDAFCERAEALILKSAACPDASVFFMNGGTQANLVVAGAVLRPFEAVIAAETGHVSTHETGAIEATGHEVLTVGGHDGKVRPGDVERLCADYEASQEKHLLVKPAMLYISYPTELGTLYKLSELEELSEICRRRGLFFYLDGARLAYGLAAAKGVTMADIARLTDAFSIGGSKCGALCCEAVLVKDAGLRRDFLQLMRVRGALMSKARLAGVQYAALFEGGLYESIGKQAVAYARKIRRMLEDKGVEPHGKSPTNQQFFVFSDRQARHFAESGLRLEECFRLPGGRVVMRICTAWSTTREQFEALKAAIETLPK